jgi:hypothetical protein
MDYLIGTIKHCERDRIDAWATSAFVFCKNAKKILICLDEVIPKSLFGLVDLGFEIIHKPTSPNSDINIVKFERHFISREYIKALNEDDIVILTDTLDVIFQSDPFKWYSKNKTNKILLTSEGISHENEFWNMGGVSRSFPNFINEIAPQDVLNSGLITGEAKYVSDLLGFIYLLSSMTKPEHSEGIDQPSMNVVMLSNLFKDITQFTTTSESFAVHCAVAGPTEQFVDWGFQKNYKYDLPIFNEGVIVNKNRQPYCIVHQYNRIKEWDVALKDKIYNSSNISDNNIYYINSENSEDHWKPFNFKNKYVLDLGCGRWFGVDNPEQYSPIWFGEQGAKGVVGVDASINDITYYTEYTKDNPKYTFIQQYIDSTKDIENILRKYPITAIKSDIEGFESYLLNIDPSLLKHITEMAIEYHSKDLKNAFIKKFKEWGYEIKTKARFSFADDSVGVLFATKKITTNKNNALVICTTYSFTAYYNNWKKDLNLSKDTYVLCDVTSGKNIPSNSILDFIQDNIINYTQENVKKSLNFNTQPSDKHWWNLGGGRSMMWFYAHLRMLYFYKTHPEYDYYWFFDDDVTFPNQQLNEFLEAHSNLDYDCMITYLFSNIGNKNPSRVPFVGPGMGSYHVPEHNWLTHYPGDGDIQPPQVTEKYGSYFPIARFSNNAMKILLQEHGKGYCGYSEGYVPTVLNYHGMKLYSIFNTESKVEANNNIIIHHKSWEMYWKNV